MGLFRKRLDPEELVRLKAELSTLRQRLDQQDGSTTELAARLGSVRVASERLAEQVGAGTVVAERVDALATRMAELDARVTAVSTELANQLSELGHEIDGLAHHPAGNGSEPAAVTELRDGQARLANEQARYQIAFREDLARLAEQLRRVKT